MNETTIRVAIPADIPILIRHRWLMRGDMGRRDEAALELMQKAAGEYFAVAVADGSYRGFLAVDAAGAAIGGGGIVISPWPGILGQRQPRRAMILNMYVEREHRRRGIARALMETMIAWCRENDFANVALHASEEGRPLYAWQWQLERQRIKRTLEYHMLMALKNPALPPTLAAAAVDAHLRSLQPGHLTDVLSSDQHTVKPWFAGKVDFAPTVHDFGADGFPLLGGRVDVLSGRTVAALAYGHARHIISVFVDTPPAGPALSGSGEIQGYHWLAWQDKGFAYIAVTDASGADLHALCELLSKN